ncbi:HEPN domain-containing protein [Candidatus Woesearchaeota archaeon]|nr:HEPN domain-containing protein [Candidatus Woesearchaeota archaeon]
MIDAFKNYIVSGAVKTKTADPEEASSLLRRAQLRMQYIRELNEMTAPLVLEDAYESAREAAQALMSIKGFKPYNHEATISFLKEFYKENFNEYELAQFDRFRELRNNSHYRAEKIIKDDAQKCVDFAKILIKKIQGILNKKNKKY